MVVGVVLPSHPVFTQPQVISSNKYIYVLPMPTGQHIAVFLTTPLPADHGAALYFHASPESTEWLYLGCLTADKPSAIYRVEGAGVAQLGIDIEPLHTLSSNALTSSVSYSALPSMASKILDNLYNYVMSFNATEYIPAKVFTDWYNGMCKKLANDPNLFK